MNIVNGAGETVEVYTAEDVQAKIAAKEAEYAPKLTEMEKIQQERDEARKALAERAGEFKQFRKLNEDTLAKLSIAEKTAYDNSLFLHEQMEENKNLRKTQYEAQVDSVLHGKVGTDPEAFKKAKDMWNLINIEALTPEQIELKANTVIGAIGHKPTNPIATVGGFSGGYMPPVIPGSTEKGFGDTEQGKAGAKELGFILEAPKQ